MMDSHNGPALAVDGTDRKVVDCSSCGFAHFWPKPTAEAVDAYYRAAFYETHSPNDWAEKEESEQPYWRIEHADRLVTLTELLAHTPGKLLDIGCGAGWLLNCAAQHGWQVLGVEPSRSMWKRAAKRAPVLLGAFPDLDLRADAPFDVVNLKQVLEHLREPFAFLQSVREVLRPGGIVCVEVPNDFNKLQRAASSKMGKPPWWVVYPVHLNYFNFETLERLLDRCGFEPLLREGTYPMEFFLLQGIDYVGRDQLGRDCHRQRMALEMSLESSGLSSLRRSFRRWLASESIGREAVVYARRR